MKSLLISANFMPAIKLKEIPKEYKIEFIQELVRINIKKEKLLSFILIAVDLVLLGIDALATNFWMKDIHIFGKFAEFHVFLFLVPFIFLLLLFVGKKAKVTSVWYYRTAHLILITFVLTFCVVIAANNSVINKQLFAYIISIFCIASLILLTRYEIFIFYISSYLLYMILVSRAEISFHDLSGNLIFLAMLVILALVVSNINFSSHIKNFINKKTILDKNAELREISALLKAQQEASPDGILIVDKSGQVLSYNNKFLELWDIQDSSMQDHDAGGLLKHLLPDIINEEGFVHQVNKVQALNLKLSYAKIQLGNGTCLDSYSAPILLFQGEAYGRVWYFRDITEKERMDEALRKSAQENEKLLRETMKYDELKNIFFSNMSHELRTPLNVILASIQLSELTLKRESTISFDKWSKNTKMIKQNCLRLLRLVNNLIDVTKIDAGFHELHLQPLNLIALIEDITLSVAEYAKGKGITTQFDTDVEEKVMYVDPDQIERIMLNLLSNAIKFTEYNGDILVNIHDNGDSILISVKDTGIGIAPDKQEIIFQRFRQVEQAFTRNYEGSGIGLSLVQSLVEMHNGKIHVESEIGTGSEFIIELPVKPGVESEYKQTNYDYRCNHVEKMNIEFSDIYMCG